MKIPQHLRKTPQRLGTTAVAAFLLGGTVLAQQLPMSYQGIITTVATNQEVANGPYDMTFRLYTSPTGGTPIWEETQHGVLVNQGLFNVHLGTAVPLKLPFAEQYYLGTTIGDGGELQPRTTLTSVPYAYRATTSDSAMTVADGAISSSKLADGAVTLSKIDATGAAAGQVLMLTDTGLAWRRQLPLPQTMAAIVDHDGTLTGTGTSPNLLGVQYPQLVAAFNTGNPILEITNQASSGTNGCAGRFIVSHSNNGADALVANTIGTGNAFAASGKVYQSGGTVTFSGGTDIYFKWMPTTASVRIGSQNIGPTTTIGNYSFGAGYEVEATSDYSAAIGYYTQALGTNAVAIGSVTTASGDYSTALGSFASTNSHDGSFVYGDASTSTVMNATADNQVMMRANGGYALHTSTDLATGLRLGTNGSLLMEGNISGLTPTSGAGTRMMWVPAKEGALRSGIVSGTQWDDANVGDASVALGNDAIASGDYSVALGRDVEASGNYSIALGHNASTNGNIGSLVYGDNSSASAVTTTADNQVMMRAENGYSLNTDATLATGLRLGNNGSLLMEGTNGSTPTSGAGTRMMWIPGKEGALRAGIIVGSPGTEWDAANIGMGSVAMGKNTLASGNYSIAMGSGTVASGNNASAFGSGSTASSDNSTAFGDQCVANQPNATAFGGLCTASGDNSLAAGYATTASGTKSIALGYFTTASGNVSTALGSYTTASGMVSTALGVQTEASGTASTATGSYASTNGMSGGFIFGDGSSGGTVINSSGNNRFEVRADHVWFGTTSIIGYPAGAYLATSTGAYLTIGGTWTNSSDRNAKTDFHPISYRSVLNRVLEMPITRWRYKADDPATHHIGPMAQDFQAAFGLSSDSTHIGTVDADGIALASIKGLYEIIQEKDGEIRTLRSSVAVQQNALIEMQRENAEMRQQNDELRQRLERVEQLLLQRAE